MNVALDAKDGADLIERAREKAVEGGDADGHVLGVRIHLAHGEERNEDAIIGAVEEAGSGAQRGRPGRRH